MDHTFDPSTLEFAAAARKFLEARVTPQSPKWDQGTPIDKAVYREMGELGLLSMRMPAEHGGLGASFVTCGRMVYEVGRADVGVGLAFVNAVVWGEIAHLMHPSIREAWTPRVIGGADRARRFGQRR